LRYWQAAQLEAVQELQKVLKPRKRSLIQVAVAWVLGTSHAITWTHNYDAAQTFDIDFSPDAGATWTPLALHVQAATATTGSFTWTVGGNATPRALIRVGPSGRPGDGDTSDVPFAVAFPTIVRP